MSFAKGINSKQDGKIDQHLDKTRVEILGTFQGSGPWLGRLKKLYVAGN